MKVLKQLNRGIFYLFFLCWYRHFYEKVPVNVFYYDAPRHDYNMFYRDERFTLKDGNDNTCTIDWLQPGKKYYIYIAAMDMYDRFTV